MDFRQLEYFTAVARLRSFTRAAEELHVSQPTITWRRSWGYRFWCGISGG